MSSLLIDWCSYEAAKYAVLHWHYSKKMPVSKLNNIGIWESGKFIGVIIFGVGATRKMVAPYGLIPEEGCELVRIAMMEHDNYVTRCVSKAIKIMKGHNPGLRLIVSYADPNQSHLGKIYQAGNWIYSGLGAGAYFYLDKNGREYHSRNIGNYEGVDKFGVTKHHYDSMVHKEKRPGKYRYLYPLDKAMRRQILPLSKPYPKRETCGQGVHGDTPASQVGDPGSSPGVRSELAELV